MMAQEKNSPRILVVDDERSIRRFLHASLNGQFFLLEASTGAEALAEAISGHPDAILLDLGLPDMDGIEVTRRLREWTQIPIIIISVRGQEEDKVTALDAGADDYLTKPFSANELKARLRVALRRLSPPEYKPVYQVDGLMVNLARRIVKVNGQIIEITPTEYDILRVFVQNPGKVITHQHLISAVWGHESKADLHLLRVNISNLRQKIEADPSRPAHLFTEPGIGYRLISEEDIP
jgi:two-component system, OmpR family, KDP operon response regulator KdpE